MPLSNRQPLKRKLAEGKTKDVESATTSKRARRSASIKSICSEKLKQSDAKATNSKRKTTAPNLSKLKSSLKKTKRLSRIKAKGNHVSFNVSFDGTTSSNGEVNQKSLIEETASCAKNELKKPAKTIKIEPKRKATKKLASSKTSSVTPSVDKNKNELKKPAKTMIEPKRKATRKFISSKTSPATPSVDKNKIELKKPAKSIKIEPKTKAIKKLASSKTSPAITSVKKNKNEEKNVAVKSADESQIINSRSAASSPKSSPCNTAALMGAVVQNDRVDSNRKRFTFENYDKPCTELSKYLLGKLLVHQMDNGCRVSGRIVETEAYLGGEDKASHSFGGKKTDRILAMYMPPGTSYVYNIYGVYACVNVSSKGDGAAVLIRSLEPVEGVETMKVARRSAKNKEEDVDKLKEHQLCNGPSKLTQALGITKANGDQVDLNTCKYMWIEDGENVDDSKIVACNRIGIANYAQEWTDKPLRFYVRNNKCVSVRDKKAES